MLDNMEKGKKKKVKLKIHVEQITCDDDLFDPDSFLDYPEDWDAPEGELEREEKPEIVDVFTEATRTETEDGRVVISYRESELTGMEGSKTELSFFKDTPGLVSLYRSGSIYTLLTFEKGKRHICSYDTLYIPLEVCVYTTKVDNGLLSVPGRLEIVYIVEFHGAKAEYTKLQIELRQ